MEISIIIPTLNERENIKELIERIQKTLNNIEFEIIFVDDGSNDGTIDIINEIRKKYKNIVLLERKKRLGLGSAFMDGLKIAKGKYIVLMDADLQHPPELLIELYNRIKEGYDLVIASRYVKGGKIEGWNVYRKFISSFAILLSHLMLPETKNIKDTMSGYFIIKRNLLEKFNVTDPYEYKVLLDILVKVNPKKVLEIPYTFSSRKHGKSKLNKRVLFSYINQIIKLFNWKQFIRFNIVGLSGVFINLLSLYFFYAFLPFYISSLLAIIISILWNFIWNDIWVFREYRNKSLLERFFLFFSSRALISKPLQYFLSIFFFYILNLNYIISQILGIIISSIVNWFLTKNMIYS